MASKQAIESGRAFVRLFLKNDMTRQLVRGLQAAQAKLKKFGQSALMAGRTFAIAGAAMLAPFALGVREFAKFDAAMRNVATMLDSPEQFLPNFRQGIKDLAVEFGKTKDDLATGLFDILSATVPPEQAMARLAAATKLAAAGNAEVADTVSVLTTLLDTYGDSFEDAADATDFLFAIVKRGRTTMGELAGGFGRLIAISKAAGLSSDDMGASMALLTRATGSTEIALTSLSAIASGVLKPQAEGARLWKEKFGDALDSTTMKAIGMTGVLERLSKLDPTEVAKVFPNIRALRGVFPAISKLEGFSTDLGAMANRAGNVNTAFEKMKGPLLFWNQGLEQARNIMVEIGVAIADVILPYKDSLESAGKTIEEFVKNNKRLVAVIAAVAAGLLIAGGVLIVTGVAFNAMAAAVGGVSVAMTFLAAHPMILLAAGLAAVAAATILYTSHAAKMADAMSTAREKADDQRRADQLLMQELQNLADKQSRTTEEMERSETIVSELDDRYGDLGITIDGTTSKIDGMADATGRLNEKMRELAIADLRVEALEAETNIEGLNQELASFGTAWKERFIGGVDDRILGELEVEFARLDAIQKRIRAAQGGDMSAVVGGDPSAPGSAPGGDPSAPGLFTGGLGSIQSTEQALAFNERMLDQIADMRIARIENEHERAVAAIDKRYDREMERARELGASQWIVAKARMDALADEDKAHKKLMRAEKFKQIMAAVGTIGTKLGVFPGEDDPLLSKGRTTLTATHSAAAARISGFQPGVAGPEEKMANGIEGVNENTKQLLVRAGEMLARSDLLIGVVERFLAGWKVP